MALSRPAGSRTRLTVLVLTSVTLMTLGLRDVPVIRELREIAGTIVNPVESAAETVTRPVRNAWHGVTDYDDVKSENDELRARLAEIEAADVAESDAEKQLADLSDVLDLPWVGDIPSVTARVVSGPRSNFSHAIQIDKGTDDGLDVGMPVITGAGLVGRVSRTSASSAVVELVTDPDFRVGVRLARTGELGTARGQGRDEPLIVDSGIRPGTEVEPDAGVATSGVDRSAYPPGIPVGTVADTREASGGLALELVVDPLADVDRLSYVDVLRWQAPA